ASPAWQQRLAGWERVAGGWQSAGGGVYLLVARKMVVGLRPLRLERREPMGKLLPLPLAKVNRSATHPDSEKH
ncbi:SAM-dependent methyltransferase, partial [Pseudomonas sp. DrBHI1]